MTAGFPVGVCPDDEMQGFLLGKPLTADAFSELLQDRMTAA
jgi:hypothetical protein